jgi:uncharacterized protein (DUF924 family)
LFTSRPRADTFAAMAQTHDPQTVLDFWFPEDGHWKTVETHAEFWNQRMQGGMDEAILRDFGAITVAAARGELDHWAETPRGRLALIIALDQFPRSFWRGMPAAYAQDIKANLVIAEGLRNGHYEALREAWERQFYIIALTHCEGPDHMARMDLAVDLARGLVDVLRPELMPLADSFGQQEERVRDVIRRFGRHPHRNAIFGRLSTRAEEAYIATGDFPHERRIDPGDAKAG